MLTKLLHWLGFADVADAIEFVLCGLGILPLLLLLGGFPVEAAISVLLLIILLALLGLQIEPLANKDRNPQPPRRKRD